MEDNRIKDNVCNLLMQIKPDLQQLDINVPFKNLGINSIDKVDLISMTSEEFSIKFSTEDFIKINTVEQLVQALTKKIKEG